MSELVLVDKSDGIAVVKVNRPDALNALNSEVIKALGTAIDDAAGDDEVRVIIITGEGRAFVAGADIGEMANLNMEQGRAFGNAGQAVFRRIEQLEKPTIAAVNGFALGGGCELAMACDIRIASEAAVFGQPETGLGITPGFSGTQRLSRIVGRAKAAELILTAKNISAAEAERIGLVSYVVAAGELMDRAQKMASDIAANAPLAVRWANSAIKRGLETDIDSGISIEADLFGMCFATQDQKEGMASFLERKKPVFRGK